MPQAASLLGLSAAEFRALQAGEWPVPWEPVWGEDDGAGARIGTWALRAALAGASRLPEAALEALLRSLAALAHRLDRRRTRAAHAFLRQAFGELGEAELERRTRQAWLHLLRVSVDTERFFLRADPERTPEHFEVTFSAEAREAVRARRGCVLVSGHLGNWEAGLSISPWVGFHPVYGVARPAKNRFLAEAMQRSRERRGVRILNRKGAMASAPAVLKAGGTIGLVVDQRASGRALLAPFFGRLARCDRSPGVLLKRHRVPVVLCASWLTDRPVHYRTSYGEVLWPDEWARAEVEEIAARVNQALERLILACPEQYVWIHDRYRDTPEELAPGAEPRIARPIVRPPDQGPPAGSRESGVASRPAAGDDPAP